MGGTSALEMYTIADEILLQLSKFSLLLKSRCILINFSNQVWHEITLSRIRRPIHGFSQSTRLFACPPRFDTHCETGVVCGLSYLID